jgi:hypothetical protein
MSVEARQSIRMPVELNGDYNGVRVDGREDRVGVLRRQPGQNATAHFTASLRTLRRYSLLQRASSVVNQNPYCCRPARKG